MMTMEDDGSTKPTSSSPTNHDGPTVPDGTDPVYITSLNQADVLLGRGAPIISYEGNVKFRDLVRSKKALYTSTGRHQAKDEIAREIVREIGRRGGRFLRKVTSPEERQAQQRSREDPLWRVADDSTAMEKVKQALRDKERSRVTSEAVSHEFNSSLTGLAALPGLGIGGLSSPMLLNPLGSSLLPSQHLGLSDQGLLGRTGLFQPSSVLDPNRSLSMLLQGQPNLREQQLQALELQIRHNEQLGALRNQVLLRSLQLQQQQHPSSLLPPTISLDPALGLEGAAAAFQAGLGNSSSAMGLLPPEATLSNAELAMLLQHRRANQMRAAMALSNPDGAILSAGAPMDPALNLLQQQQGQNGRGVVDGSGSSPTNISNTGECSSSESAQYQGDDDEEGDEDDEPATKRLKTSGLGS